MYTKQKSTFIAWLLLLTLGTAGAHRFYIRDVKGGTIRLISFVSLLSTFIITIGVLNTKGTPETATTILYILLIALVIVILILFARDAFRLTYIIHIMNGGTNETYYTSTAMGQNARTTGGCLGTIFFIVGLIIAIVLCFTGAGAAIGIPLGAFMVITMRTSNRIRSKRNGLLSFVIAIFAVVFHFLLYPLFLTSVMPEFISSLISQFK
jgi:TM2 domain-containing membrane protein YozV